MTNKQGNAESDIAAGLVFAVDGRLYSMRNGENLLVAEKNKSISSLVVHENTLVYSAGNSVFDALTDKKMAERDEDIVSLAVCKGVLYDACDSDVRETYSGKSVFNKCNCSVLEIRALTAFRGNLYNSGYSGTVYETFTGERYDEHVDRFGYGQTLGFVEDAKDLYAYGWYRNERESGHPGFISSLFNTTSVSTTSLYKKDIIGEPRGISTAVGHNREIYCNALDSAPCLFKKESGIYQFSKSRVTGDRCLTKVAERRDTVFALAVHKNRLYDASTREVFEHDYRVGLGLPKYYLIKVFDTLEHKLETEGDKPIWTFESKDNNFRMISVPLKIWAKLAKKAILKQ